MLNENVELFNKLIQSKVHEIVEFPRKNNEGEPLCDLALVLLSNAEDTAVIFSAQKEMKKYTDLEPNTESYNEILNHHKAIELLFKVCRNSNDLKAAFFPDKKAISSVLTTDEISILINHYMHLKAKSSVIVADMTEEAMKIYIDRLKEGGSSAGNFLSSFTWVALTDLLMYMAKELHNLQTVKSSSTTQQNNGSQS